MSLILLKTLLRNLILPPSSPLLLGFLGFSLLRRYARTARVLLAISLVSLWVLSVPVVADALSGLVERSPALDLKQPTDAQAIVILGGGGQLKRAPEYGGPTAEPALLERLTYGAYLSRKTGLPILVTGAPAEASAMRTTLSRNFGIEVRWVDDQAGDTFQNASNSMRLLHSDGVDRILLVTRATHMGRSAEEFRAVGFDVTPAPVGFASARDHGLEEYFPGPDGLLRSHLALYELMGEQVRRFLAFTHLREH